MSTAVNESTNTTSAQGRPETPSSLIAVFLAARNLAEPDGRPLYAYRCSSAELSTLERSLAYAFQYQPTRLGIATQQAFCLWAAESFRRSYRGGVYNWLDILDRVGASYLAPGSFSYSALGDSVAKGLTAWRRDLVRTAHGRLFLVTLVCEGGLPMYLVQRGHGHLRTFFRSLFDEVRVHQATGLLGSRVSVQELAREVSNALPASLRQDVVFELSGQLVLKIWELLGSVPDAGDPIAALDARRPGWREELPLDLDDELARVFLNRLVSEARAISRGRKTSVELRRFLSCPAGAVSHDATPASVVFDLSAQLELASTLSQEECRGIFGEDAALRFELCLADDSGAIETIALATARAEGTGYRIERTDRSGRVISGQVAVESRGLMMRSPLRRVGPSLQFRGALNLASLPWVFVTSDTVGTEQRFDLVGQGTHRVREPEALVAVADAWAVQPEADSICELIGATQKLDENRKVYRLSGAASFSNAGTRCRIATSDPQATAAADYRLFGRRLDLGRGNPPVFRGLPSIMRSSPSGVDSPTPRHEVQWRSAQASSPWLPLSERCYGDGQLRHVVDGAEQFRTRVRIAPRSLAIRFQPDGAEAGAILFEGGDGLSVACNSAEGVIWSAERLNGTVTMRLRATRGVPSSVTAQLVWGVGARLELVLPFPANQVGFVALDGNRIDSGSTITVGQLSGISALAMVPRARRAYRIECTIVTARFGGAAARRAFVSYPMTESSLGMHTFDLGALQDSVLEQLSASDDLDCAVRVSIHGDRSDDAIPSLLVRRYDLQFVADLDESTLRIPASLLVGRIPSQVSSLHVEAVSLISPDSETVVLERIGKSEWSLDNPYLTPGPWLILGWSGEWCRARPRLFEAQRAQTPVSAPRRPADGLAAACTIADRFDRRKAITASIRNLAQDPDHDDWQLLRAHVRLTKDVSPSTFDTICCLVENSAACALGALVLPEDEPELFDTYWSALRLLPFSWLAVPGVVWREAMKTWLTVRRDALRGLGLDSAMAVNMVNAQRYESAKRNLTGEGRLTWLVPALEMARNAALGISSSRESIAVRQGLMNDQCLTMYFGAIAQLPAAPLDGRDPLPPTYHLNKRLSLLGSGRAQRLRVDPSRMPGVVGDARSAFLNAPAIAAVAAVAGEFLDTEAQLDLRAAYDHDRSWFGEAYNWAYLYMSALD